MFGNNGPNDQTQQDQANVGAQPAGPGNDFGTMPSIENTPFGAPAVPDNSVPVDTAAPADDMPAPAAEPVSAPVADGAADELLNIKQDALQQLTPLVGHLDQSPEEKFRTTMMMIQAADDQNLVKDAFDAAKAITDDKARAQALLDVINEINYFTQHNNQ